ncbi:type VII toxin-antitoxin system MntA family adenylyltransferase antitoxin [Haloplanus pelagicus]|jgi:predicted nucleotidyltransferase|uniref:type VII toxin-antitoxin system MntA family adenylyltransferase antitoxin n=1 Tax=Haloplanus pelagicus TaxID=2949995 RepID=UPI00203E6CBF|nr:nucleotidyltransferase domain-containing protein [Haloplanus sp. HW8-1]
MSPSAEHSQVVSALEEAVCSDPEITFAVLFGSQISGESTLSSDFDLAIKFANELSDRDRFEKRCFLSGDLQHEGRPFIDVSDIESLPLDVAHDAVNGELLCGDEQVFEQFKRDIEAEFDEQRETLRRQQRAVIDRIAEDGLRG